MSKTVYNNVSTNKKTFYTTVPAAYLPEPTDADYSRKWIYRNFMRKINDQEGEVIEISDKQYEIFNTNPFYATIRIKWNISDLPVLNDNNNNDGAIAFNRRQIRKGMLTISNLYTAFNNLLQFHVSKGREAVGFLLPEGYVMDERGVVAKEVDEIIIGKMKIR